MKTKKLIDIILKIILFIIIYKFLYWFTTNMYNHINNCKSLYDVNCSHDLEILLCVLIIIFFIVIIVVFIINHNEGDYDEFYTKNIDPILEKFYKLFK